MKAANIYQVSKQSACQWYGISCQAYYQARKRQVKREAEDQLLLTLIRNIRKRHPRMGGRKLRHKLREPMGKLEISRGRDAFFSLLRRHNLLVPPKRSRRRTTRSDAITSCIQSTVIRRRDDMLDNQLLFTNQNMIDN